jgi:hypothetical protein
VDGPDGWKLRCGRRVAVGDQDVLLLTGCSRPSTVARGRLLPVEPGRILGLLTAASRPWTTKSTRWRKPLIGPGMCE